MSLFAAHGDVTYDTRRQSFLEFTGRSAPQRLRLAIDAALHRVRAMQDNAAIVAMMEEWRTAYEALCNFGAFDKAPEGFYATAWPCYKETIRRGEYYFSVDELIVFARMAEANLIVTKYDGGVFQVAGSTFHDEASADVIYVSLTTMHTAEYEVTLNAYGPVL